MAHGIDQFRGRPATTRAVYDRYASWLRNALISRYGIQDADDLAQETWLRLTPYHLNHDIRHPKALLLKIASNLAADGFSKQSRSQRRERDAASFDLDYQMPPQSDELLAKQIVLSLPQPLRDVFVLSRIGGLANSQIADQLGISLKTVEKRMTKALAHCAAQLRL